MIMHDERTIIVAIPVPEFIFTAVHSQYLPVAQDGYHSRYGWTNKLLTLSKLPLMAQTALRTAKEIYYVHESSGLVNDSAKVYSTSSMIEDPYNYIAPMVGICTAHVYGASEPTVIADVFSGKANENSSDWEDYLWAGYNDFLLLAEVPVDRCLIWDRKNNLVPLSNNMSWITDEIILVPFISQHEVLDYYMKVEDPERANGERAWVNLKHPDSVYWGSGHGSIQPDCRESVMKLVQQKMTNEFANWCEGNTSVF